MKHFLLLALFIFPGYFWAQVVTQAHTHSNFFEAMIQNGDNTIVWFETNQDSVFFDDRFVIIRKGINDPKRSTYFLVLDSSKNVIATTKFYIKKPSSSINPCRFISLINNEFYVSFFYSSDSLWVNDSLFVQDSIPTKNLCIAKFSIKGELISIGKFPVQSSITLAGIEKYPLGGLVIYGYSFGKTTFGTFNLPCLGCHVHDCDIFVAKISNTWEVLNARTFGSTFWDYGKNMSVGDDGALYLTGDYYGSTFEVDGFSLKNQGVTQYSSDAFLLKMDGNLNVQWLKRASSSLLEKGLHLEKAPDGDMYWGVEYISDKVTYEDTTLIGQAQNAFVARVNPQGDLVWIQNITSNDDLRLKGFSTDDQGSVWTNVFFTGDLTLDGATVAGQGVEKGYVDNLIVNIGPNGQLNRQYFLGGPDDERIYHIEALANNRLLIEGTFYGDTLSFLNMQLPKSKASDNSTEPTYFYAIMEYPTVGIPELAPVQVHPLRLSPNPCSRQLPLTIQVPVRGPLPAAGTFQVANLQGTVVGSFPADALTRTATVLPGYLQAGVYVVTYYAEQAMWVGKLVVID
jgi:hypothetical protein